MEKLMVSLAILFFSVSSGWATTIHVPDEYGTIQTGIDAAVDGDTVLVADGTYAGEGNKDIDYGGKAITVMSENGAEATIIDCEEDGRGFYFHTDEDSLSILDGFTITNGNISDGGGIYCYGSYPTIQNCIIEGNEAGSSGGGIWCFGSTSAAKIISCAFSDNTGGGIYCTNSSPIIKDCTVEGNEAFRGGGIFCHEYSDPDIWNCAITGNTVDDDGGGIFCDASSDPDISSCTISNNTAYKDGGGIYCEFSSPAIKNCNITGNTAYYGGGIYCTNSSPIIKHCTISGNTADVEGGGIYCTYSSSPDVINCILWGDFPQEIYILSGDPSVTYSNIEGGWEGEGNIDADPLFADTTNHDFHLTEGSPCIDTGYDAGVYEDFEGDVRPWGDGFDIGADEFVVGGLVSTILECDDPIVVRGEYLEYRAGLINNTDEEQNVEAWLDLYLINGEPYPKNPYLGPISITLGPNHEVIQNRQEYVPVFAPLGGPYSLYLRVGPYPKVLDESFFEFDVAPKKN